MTQKEKKRLKFSCLDLVSNTDSNRETISATGLGGTAIIFIGLLVYLACVIFYFFNVAEAANILVMMNSATTLIGIGAGVLGVRRVSADFGPNNKVVLTDYADDGTKTTRTQKLYNTPSPIPEEAEPAATEETQNN